MSGGELAENWRKEMAEKGGSASSPPKGGVKLAEAHRPEANWRVKWRNKRRIEVAVVPTNAVREQRRSAA